MVTADDLARDGLEPMGTVTVGATTAVCDPSEVTGGVRRATKPGEWAMFVRGDADDPDTISEAVLVHPGALASFWQRYDEAVAAGELVASRGRIVVMDVRKAGDTALRAAMFEPDELPWLFDGGAVLPTRADGKAQLFFSGNPAILASVVFGAAAVVVPGTVTLDDEQG
jgi:hypothetical protein